MSSSYFVNRKTKHVLPASIQSGSLLRYLLLEILINCTYFMASTKICSNLFSIRLRTNSFRCVKIIHFHIAFEQNILKHIYHITWKTYFRMWMEQGFFYYPASNEKLMNFSYFFYRSIAFHHFSSHNCSTNEKNAKISTCKPFMLAMAII